MVQLSLSVPLANILLWTFTEAFIVLMAFYATRLLARYLLNHRLSRGHKVPLIPSPSLVDSLPYNSDLEPLPRRAKLLLTFLRFAAVGISVYLGATLDAAVAPADASFNATQATAVATTTTAELTRNSGAHIPAMAKLSCLRIRDNNNVVLYRGYVAGEHILCEDGSMTYTTAQLVHAQIRPGFASGMEGEDLSELNIADGLDQRGLYVTDKAVVYNRTDDDGNPSEEGLRIILLSRHGGSCVFGVRRSPGSGFEQEVDIKLETTCGIRILDFGRMLASKPGCLPPRMSFLHQTLDALVVSEHVDGAPLIRGATVQATITLEGLVTAVVSAVIITVSSIVLWFALRNEGVKKDFTSVKGLAEMWGEEKFGSSSQGGVFVALPKEGGSPYLGSMDGKGGDVENGDMDLSDLECGERVSNICRLSSEFGDTCDTEESSLSVER